MAAHSDEMAEAIPWAVGARLILEGEPAGPDRSSSSLEDAVRRFWEVDWEVQSTATLLVDQGIALDGQPPRSAFYGDEIDALVRRLSR